MGMAFANQNRSIADVLRDVLSQLTTLLRKEAQLARVELSENINRAGLARISHTTDGLRKVQAVCDSC